LLIFLNLGYTPDVPGALMSKPVKSQAASLKPTVVQKNLFDNSAAVYTPTVFMGYGVFRVRIPAAFELLVALTLFLVFN
jgi:hypothetical protein